MLDSIFGGIPRSLLTMFPAVRAAAVDDVEEPGWETIVKEGIPWSRELVLREVCEASWGEELVMVFELVTGTIIGVLAVGRPVSETDTGVHLEGERDRAPMVCPMVVVFPDKWI